MQSYSSSGPRENQRRAARKRRAVRRLSFTLHRFGRVGKDEFTMDFQWPMTPFQAFAITLSSFDSKIACD